LTYWLATHRHKKIFFFVAPILLCHLLLFVLFNNIWSNFKFKKILDITTFFQLNNYLVRIAPTLPCMCVQWKSGDDISIDEISINTYPLQWGCALCSLRNHRYISFTMRMCTLCSLSNQRYISFTMRMCVQYICQTELNQVELSPKGFIGFDDTVSSVLSVDRVHRMGVLFVYIR